MGKLGSECPQGWVRCTLGEVVKDIVGGGTPSKNVPEYFQGQIPLMTVKDMKERRPSKTGFNITEQALASSSARMIPADTVIIATRMGLGKVVRAPFPTAINQDLKALFAPPELDKSFLEFWLMSVAGKLESMGTGTTVKGIRLGEIRLLEFPLPPLKEQQRIVEKIETLFTMLDKGEESVREVQKLLTRYRQSVLKAAVTGQLTADWRRERVGTLEHGRDLLQRSLEERRQKWIGRGKYKEPKEPDLSGLPELPDGWVWTILDAIITNGPQNGIYLPQSKYGAGTPIIRIDDFQTGWTRPVNELRRVVAEQSEVQLYSLKRGDFVINRVNSVSHLGKTMLVNQEHEGALFESNMMRLSVTTEVDGAYLEAYLSSAIGRKRLIANCKHAVNQASINQGDVRATPVPLPPIDEQKEIATLASETLSRIEDLEHWCEKELKRSASLRQSILKDAFAGKLVPQDPTDEPASALLARIATSKDTAKKPRRKTKA